MTPIPVSPPTIDPAASSASVCDLLSRFRLKFQTAARESRPVPDGGGVESGSRGAEVGGGGFPNGQSRPARPRQDGRALTTIAIDVSVYEPCRNRRTGSSP